jgi:hypothetical protein
MKILLQDRQQINPGSERRKTSHSTSNVADRYYYLLYSINQGKIILCFPPAQIFGRCGCWRLCQTMTGETTRII